MNKGTSRADKVKKERVDTKIQKARRRRLARRGERKPSGEKRREKTRGESSSTKSSK